MKAKNLNLRVCILLLAFVMVGLLAGCSTPMATLHTVRDPSSDLSRGSQIAVLIDPKGSIDDRQFAGFLMQQMRSDGFNLVAAPQPGEGSNAPSHPTFFQDLPPKDQQAMLGRIRENLKGSPYSSSDSELINCYNERALVLRERLLKNADFVLVSSTEVLSAPYTINVPYDTSTTTFGSVGGVPYYEQTPSTTWVPTTNTYWMKSITLNVYSLAALRSDPNASDVWMGNIVGAENEFEKSPTNFLNTLLLHFGQDFNGTVHLVRAKK